MKKKLFRSLIVSLFVFTLFISVSNAEIVADTNYSKTTYSHTGSTAAFDVYFPDTSYSADDIKILLQDFLNNGNMEAFNEVQSFFASQGYGTYYSYYISPDLYVYFYNSSACDVGICLDSDNTPQYMFLSPNVSNDYFTVRVRNNTLTINKKNFSVSSMVFQGVNYDSVLTYGSENSMKQLYYISTDTWCWDGSSYYGSSGTEPIVPMLPEFSTELTDDKIASVVQNFSNSPYWKNRNSNYTGFFIQHNELTDYYLVMMVPYNMIQYGYLRGIYIPANIFSSNFNVLDYDSYSLKYNNDNFGAQLPWNKWMQSFKIYESYDGLNFNYTGEMHLKEYGQYRFPMTSPIIYSNFTIPFKTLIGETSDDNGDISDSYTEESDYIFSDLVNSETGESYVFDDVPVEDNPLIRALGDFFKDLTNYLSSAFEFVLNKIFNFSEYLLNEFGENAFTLLFAIIIEAFSALVAGISLLVRFAGFLLTLVAIPADSSLFNVLVDGSAWGTHFIEGLNFLKGLSWNNLNLWTFFECFVAALEVIWTVRIVRRHYSQVV